MDARVDATILDDVEAHGLRERVALGAIVAATTAAAATPMARAADAPPRDAQTSLTQDDAALRAEIAGALNVDPSDGRVDIAIVEGQLNGTLKPPAAVEPVPAAPVIGPAVKYDPVAERLDLIKKEMDKAGLTDEMIRDGYYKETPFTIGSRSGFLIEALLRTPAGPISMHGLAITQKDGSTQQSVLITNLATGAQGLTTASRDVDGNVTMSRDDRLGGGGSSGNDAPASADAPSTSASGGDTDDGTTFRSTSFVKDGTTYTDSETRFKDGTTVNTSSSSSDRGTTTETRVTDGAGNEIYHNETKTDSDGNVTKSDSGPSEEDGTPTEGTSDDDSGTAAAMTSDDGSAAGGSVQPLGPTRLDQLGHRIGGELGDPTTVELDDKGQPILRNRPIVGDPSGEPAAVDDGTLHVIAAAGPEYGPDGRPTVDTSGGPPSNDPYGPISNRP